MFNEDNYDVSPIALKHEGNNFTLQINIFQTWRQDTYIVDSPSTTPLTGLTFWHRSFTFNSNKSPTWCKFFSSLSWRLFTAQDVSGVFPPIIRSSMIAVAVSGFTFVSWWQSCCVRLSPRYEGKTRGCHCSHWAPDDGRENARNMLSCKQTSG